MVWGDCEFLPRDLGRSVAVGTLYDAARKLIETFGPFPIPKRPLCTREPVSLVLAGSQLAAATSAPISISPVSRHRAITPCHSV